MKSDHKQSQKKSSSPLKQENTTQQRVDTLALASENSTALKLQIKTLEEELKKSNHTLSERLKEMHCLYTISQLASQPDVTLNELIDGVLAIVPKSWQFPTITACKIQLKERCYYTSNYKKTEWSIKSPIRLNDGSDNFIEVCYLEQKPEEFQGPFFEEEVRLLDEIARDIGGYLEKRFMGKSLHTHEHQLEKNNKKHTKELRDSQTRIELAVEANNLGLYEYDITTKEIAASDLWFDIVGIPSTTPKEEIPEVWYSRVHPEDRAFAEATHENAIKSLNNKMTTLDIRYNHPTRGLIWLHESGRILDRNSDGTGGRQLGYIQDITIEKKQAQEIRESQYRLKTLFENMPNALAEHEIICDDKGTPVDYRFLNINPAFTAQTLLTEDIVGKTAKEVLPGLEDYWIERYGTVALTGESAVFEEYYPPLDKYFKIHAFSKHKGHFATIFDDVTLRVRQEEKITKQEENYHNLFEQSINGIFIMDSTNGALIDCNQTALKIFEAESKEQLLGHIPSEFSPEYQPDGKLSTDVVKEQIEKVIREGEARFEFMQISLSGKKFVSDVSLSMTTYNDKTVIQSITQDITAKKQAEEESRKIEKDYRALFEQSFDAVYILNIDTATIVDCNARAVELLKADSKEAIIGLSPIDISPPYQENGETSEAYIRDFIKDVCKHGSGSKLMNHNKFDGEQFVAEVNVVSAVYQNQPSLLAVIRDVSQQKRDELALIQAKNIAESATKAKSQFLATMSHEIRTPMNGIVGLTQLLLKTDLNQKQEEYLRKIILSSDSLQRIIDDILDFSKFEAGKMMVESVDFCLKNVVEKVENFLHPKILEKDIQLTFHISNQVPPTLIGDPFRIEQVLLNLATNAVKFTHKGEVALSIGVTEIANNIATLTFSIQDSGIGISEDHLRHLFQPFMQADSTTTRKYGGTGLGLAISKRLIEMMGGTISVSSSVGTGSKFTFTLKLGVANRNAQDDALYTALENLDILVVDDQEVSRTELSSMLKELSFTTHEVDSGEKALQFLQKRASSKPLDIILMDWHMPQRNGIDVAMEIKSQTKVTTPSIIMITADVDIELPQKALDLGIEVVLQKPVGSSSLMNAIMDVVENTLPDSSTEMASPAKLEHIPDSLVGTRILLVEDNEINQEVAKEILIAEGFNVTVANNGKIAIEIIEKDPSYAAILMDIQMPVMDGVEATKILRSQHQYDTLPIIAMTANVMQEDIQRYLDAGMNDNIAKPIKISDLISTIVKWVSPTATKKPTKKQTPAEPIRPADSNPELEIPGIDVPAALSRLAGNKDLFVNLLHKFQITNDTTGREIVKYIKLKEYGTAAGIAHAIKGVAGNLGADELYTAATKLNDALKLEELENIDALTENFCLELMKINEEIQKLR